MIKKISALSIIFVLLLSMTVEAFTFYTDIEDNWAKDDIMFATNTLEVFRGYTDGSFKPEEYISRSEFCTILARTCVKLGMVKESYTSKMNYEDLSVKNWSYTYIITLYEYINYFEEDAFEKIFPGKSFNPEQSITRREVVQLVSKFCKYSILDNNISFDDIKEDDDLYGEIKVLYNAGILTGFMDNTMKLDNILTRAESAAIIKRIYNYIELCTVDKLDKLNYMHVENSDVNSFFSYGLQTDQKDGKYIKAKNTLEYLEFGGYIFPDDVHLYDERPIETLEMLRNEKYVNLLGVDFYLVKYGEFDSDKNIVLANELLDEVIKREKLDDFEYEQICALLVKLKVDENKFMQLLEKWDDSTDCQICKFNINTYAYNYYLFNDNMEAVEKLLQGKLNAYYNLSEILKFNLKDINQAIDNSFSIYNNQYNIFEVYNLENYDKKEITSKVVLLDSKYLLEKIKFIFNSPSLSDQSSVEKDDIFTNTENFDEKVRMNESENIIETINISMNLKEQEIFYNYALNKAKLMYDMGKYERAFIDLINEYEIMKTLEFYKNKTEEIDIKFESILLELKYKSNLISN